MASTKLREILDPRNDEKGLRWRATVPVATNIFILTEFLQLTLLSCLIAVVSLAIGLYLSEGAVYPEDIVATLRLVALFFGIVFALFLLLSLLLLKNRYYVTYRMNYSGIFYEVIRGKDQSEKSPLARMRPYPAEGEITVSRERSRHLIWEKISSFQNISSMRVIILRRGMWQMLKLYTPDAATHGAVVEYLRARFNGDKA